MAGVTRTYMMKSFTSAQSCVDAAALAEKQKLTENV
jgi:hypothetical protein